MISWRSDIGPVRISGLPQTGEQIRTLEETGISMGVTLAIRFLGAPPAHA